MYLRRHWDVQRNVAATSPRRLNSGWGDAMMSFNCFIIFVGRLLDPAQRENHVESTSIRRRPNFNELSRRFHVLFRRDFADRIIHVVSTYFFRCNFDGGKIHVVSTCFFRCNFDGREIHVVSTNFFRCNFDGGKIHVLSTHFFDVISLIEKSTSFPRTFFDVISIVEKSPSFPRTFSM